MANGFFLGGAAEGMAGAQKMALAENELAQNTALRTRGLDMQERQLGHNISQDIMKQADAQIANTMAVAADTIKAGLEGGADPAKLRATVAPLLQSAQSIAGRIGRDPAALAAQLDAQLTNPNPVARAAVTGRAAGTQRIEQARAEEQIETPTGQRVELSPYKTPEEKVKLENALRDDFTKGSKDFIIIRDFHDRIRSSAGTGADDLALVFSYMKVLDPASTVREGEFRTASQIAGLPGVIETLRNKVLGQGQLSEGARKDIKQAADKIWTGALSRHSQMVTNYTNIAKRTKLDPRNVVIDLTAGGEGPTTRSGAVGDIKWNWVGE